MERREGDVGVSGPRHAEVDHFRLAIPAHENVAGFEITVHDPHAMAIGHRRRHTPHDRHTLPYRQPTLPREAIYGQRILHELHHKKRDRHATVVTGAERVDLRNVGMPKPCQQMRFLLEAFHDRAAGEAIPQDFDRNRPCGRLLEPLVDAAHAPFSQHADDRDPAKVATGH